ncbi:hypothetical protein [Clostridium sporogenes]
MEKKNDIGFSVDKIYVDKILIRVLLRKLGYDEKIIDNNTEIFKCEEN